MTARPDIKPAVDPLCLCGAYCPGGQCPTHPGHTDPNRDWPGRPDPTNTRALIGLVASVFEFTPVGGVPPIPAGVGRARGAGTSPCTGPGPGPTSRNTTKGEPQ